MNTTMKFEIDEIAELHKEVYAAEIVESVESILKQDYDHTLDTTLFEVMDKGNHLTKDHHTNQHSNFLNIYRKRVEDILNKAGNPKIAVDAYVKDVERDYFEKTHEKVHTEPAKIPIIKWDRSAIGFYCNQQGYDAPLIDLLYFIVVLEYGTAPWIDSFHVGNALHELSRGVADSLLLRELNSIGAISLTKLPIEEKSNDNTNVQVIVDLLQQFRSDLLQEIRTANSSQSKNREANVGAQADIYDTFFDMKETKGLADLQKELVKYGYIDKSVSESDFRRVFLQDKDPLKNKLLGKSVNPLEWKKPKNHLWFLIKELKDRGIIRNEFHFIAAQNCFTRKGKAIHHTKFHETTAPNQKAVNTILAIITVLYQE